MSRRGLLGRRRLLGLGFAAVVGGSVGLLGSTRDGVRWGRVRAYPGARVPLHISLPLGVSARGRLFLELSGPDGERSLPLGEVALRSGGQRIMTPLKYPHDGRIPGHYSYRVRVLLDDGRSWTTPTSVGYRIRRAAWLS